MNPLELTLSAPATGTSGGTASTGVLGSPSTANSALLHPQCRGARTGSTFSRRAPTRRSGKAPPLSPPLYPTTPDSLTPRDRHKWWNGQSWGGWESIGGAFPLAIPSATTWGSNRLDVFSVGNDASVWHRWWDGQTWSVWEPLQGQQFATLGLASVAWGPNRLDVFGVGTDRAMWHKSWDGSNWGAWESLKGMWDSDPVAVSWGPNRIDVFALGMDKAVWHKGWDGTQWGNWQSLGGEFTSVPKAVADQPNRLNVYAVGTDHVVWQMVGDGSTWGPWQSLMGPAVSSTPAVTSWGPGRVDLFVLDTTDGALWHNW